VLRLTKKADYGLIAMQYLAERHGRGPAAACSAKELAEAYGLPQQALAKILQRLARSGLLVSTQGANGGYVLARSPRQISLLEVIRAIEGQMFITTCVTTELCEQSHRCTIREPLRKVNDSIAAILSGISIADVGESEAERAADSVLIHIEEGHPAGV
jgi:Rrf2 family protein